MRSSHDARLAGRTRCGHSSPIVRYWHHAGGLSGSARSLRENPLDLPATCTGIDAAGDRCVAAVRHRLQRVPQKHRNHEHPAGARYGGPGCAALSQPAAYPPAVLAYIYYAGSRRPVRHALLPGAGLVVRCRAHDPDDHGAEVGDLADCHAGGRADWRRGGPGGGVRADYRGDRGNLRPGAAEPFWRA
ncbi:hypothetical protein D3C76_1065320 [compost metagenome]